MMKKSKRSDVDPFIVMDVMESARIAEEKGKDIIHMEVGQPGTPAPKIAKDYITNEINKSNLGYTVSLGLPALRTKISKLYGDWYNLPWLGYFYDASSGWVYHTKLGWMYSKEESNGNFWLYESDLGWLWTGPSYFDATSETKAFVYSVSDAGWLYFKPDGGVRKFYRYSDQKWILANRTETQAP